MLVGCVVMAIHSNALLRTIPVVPPRPRYSVSVLHLAAYTCRKDCLYCLPIRDRSRDNGNFGDQYDDHCCPKWSSFVRTLLCRSQIDSRDDQDQIASFQTLKSEAGTVHQSLDPFRKLLGVYAGTPIHGHILGRSSTKHTGSVRPAATRIHKELG